LADHLDVRLELQGRLQPAPEQPMVVHDQHADGVVRPLPHGLPPGCVPARARPLGASLPCSGQVRRPNDTHCPRQKLPPVYEGSSRSERDASSPRGRRNRAAATGQPRSAPPGRRPARPPTGLTAGAPPDWTNRVRTGGLQTSLVTPRPRRAGESAETWTP